ncbi:MAG: nuclear transport factor 2 family protein [Terriglobales bacterium]
MHRILIALSLAVLSTFSMAQTSVQTAVIASINQFVDGFNKGDTKMAVAACADETSIIDEFPPHEWHGAGACEKWASDFDADAKKNGITDEVVTLGKASHVDISSDYAYVVVPANYAFKQNGKPVSEIGSIITLSLKKSPSGWRITGWAWAKH